MDITSLGERLAIGGGIWTAERMAELKALGFTHIVNLQVEFDDRPLAAGLGLEVLWNPAVDDLEPKPAAFFERTVAFVRRAWKQPGARVYIHCAAGVHRAPLAAAAVLCAAGEPPSAVLRHILNQRPIAEFPPVYLASLYAYLEQLT